MKKKFVKGRFSWQEGFGAFSYSLKELHIIAEYICNQKSNHQKKAFLKEYQEMLEYYGVNYDDRYVFTPVLDEYIVPDGTPD